MRNLLRYAGQAVCYGIIAAVLGYFSSAPAYRWFGEDEALIKLSLAHGGQRKGCRRLSREELLKLAPNMRKPVSCPRARLPVVVRLAIDGREVLHDSFPPIGLSKDGPSKVYRTFAVPAGEHVIVAELRDSDRRDGFDHRLRSTVTLAPHQSMAIEFRPDRGGFVFE